MKKKLVYLIYAICGMLMALPSVIEQFWLLSWVAFVPVLYHEFTREPDEKRPFLKAWLRGLSFFYFYGLIIFYWFVELYPLDFAGLTPAAAIAVVIIAWFGLPLLQSVSFAFLIVFVCFFCRKLKKLAFYPIYCACLWVIFEWLQTLTWAGVPWGKLAVGQVGQLANVQSASLLGSYFVAFIMIVVSACLALAAIHFKENKRRALTAIICAIIIFEANSIFGFIRLGDDAVGETVTVAALQANISSDDKWSGDVVYTFEKYRKLTEFAAENGAELIVWSESAIPYTFNNEEIVKDFVSELIDDTGVPLIVGTFYKDDSGLYNVTNYIEDSDKMFDQIYAKRKLVPFGEFVPMRKFVTLVYPPLSEIQMLESDIMPGRDSRVFETEIGYVGSLICFDSIYDSVVRKSVTDGAELLVISTNDSWFHDSSAVYQHNKHAQLRSIENGRYTVRSANTGISSIITDKGVVKETLPPLVEGYVMSEVEMISENTIYTTVGNLLVWVSFALTAIVICSTVIKDFRNGYTHRKGK